MKIAIFVALLLLILPGVVNSNNGYPWQVDEKVWGVGDNQTADPFTICSLGYKGGGYDTVTQKYDWTCGNYNWSAEVGGVDANGISDYNTPTTVGGNSWTLNCSGDGTADNNNITVQEATPCLYDGEKIKMYAMADLMLAQDNLNPGGTVYLPKGLYHDRFCGQQEGGAANNCPVLSSHGYDTNQTRYVTRWGKNKIIGEGDDPNGAHIGGRTGTYWIIDYAADRNNDRQITAAAYPTGDGFSDPGGTAGFLHGHWAFRDGFIDETPVCNWDETEEACVATGSNTLSSQAMSPIAGGQDAITGDVKIPLVSPAKTPYVCIENDLTVQGVCSGDLRVRCDVDNDTANNPTSPYGGCPGILDTCIGFADAIDQVIQENIIANKTVMAAMFGRQQDKYGEPGATSTTQVVALVGLGEVTSDSTDCGTGVRVNMSPEISEAGTPQEGGGWFSTFYDQSAMGASTSIFVVDEETFNSVGGFTSDMTFMPASWVGRDSVTAAADCLVDSGAPGNNHIEEACDETELFALAAMYGGGVYDSSFLHGAGAAYPSGASGTETFGFAVIDGRTTGLYREFSRNTIAFSAGRTMDSNNRITRNNVWKNNVATGRPLVNIFTNEQTFKENTFIQNTMNNGLIEVDSPTSMINIDDVLMIDNVTTTAFFRSKGMQNSKISNVRGWGNQGGILWIDPKDFSIPLHTWNFDFEDVRLTNHGIGTQNQNRGLITLYDDLGDATAIDGLLLGNNNIRNVSVQIPLSEYVCGFFLEGGTGDDLSATNGQGRTVDENRKNLYIDGFDVEIIDSGEGTGSYHTFCFPDNANNPHIANDTTIRLNDVVGELPTWKNVMENGVRIPDSPGRSLGAASCVDLYDTPSASTPQTSGNPDTKCDQDHTATISSTMGDCEEMSFGTQVYIYDDRTANNACEDADMDGVLDGGGIYRSLCACDPNGDSGDGVWTPVPVLNIATSGTIEGHNEVVSTSGTTDVLTREEVRGTSHYATDTGVVTYTLPAAEAGMSACFYDLDATAIVTIEIDDADIIKLNGSDLTAGNTIDSPGASGDYICLQAIDDTTWVTLGRAGAWVDGGAT